MNRRHFLSAVTAAVGAFALDPERLLWVPGQKTYFDIVRLPCPRANAPHLQGINFAMLSDAFTKMSDGLMRGRGPDNIILSRSLYASIGGDLSTLERE